MDFKFTGMDGDGDKLSSPCSSLVRIQPVAAVYHNANSPCHPTSKSWGVNGHTTRCIGPVSVVRLRAKETEISAARLMGP